MFTCRFLPLAGGVETHVDEVARRLVARGTDVTVLTTDPTGRLPRREDRHGVVVRRFPVTLDAEISICRPHWCAKSDLVRTTSSTFRDSPDSFHRSSSGPPNVADYRPS